MSSPSSTYEFRQEKGVFAGVNYAYRVAPPTPPTASAKWALLQHGFPAGTHSWRFVVPALVAKGYHVVVPDMLGYGGTDKPSELKEFKGKKICASLLAIMDKEGAQRFISVGHDWGTFPATRMALYYPERVSGVALASVGYNAPAPGMTLEDLAAMLVPILGYDNFSYWNFFSSEDAGPLVDKHVDTFLNILFSKTQPDDWKKYLADHVEFRKAVEEDRVVARASHTTDEDFNIYKNELSDGAFASRFNWYKSHIAGQNWEDEQEIPVIKNGDSIHLKMPVLYILGALDAVCHPALQQPRGEPKTEDLTIELLQADHWIMEMMPTEFNAILGKWIDEKVKA